MKGVLLSLFVFLAALLAALAMKVDSLQGWLISIAVVALLLGAAYLFLWRESK